MEGATRGEIGVGRGPNTKATPTEHAFELGPVYSYEYSYSGERTRNTHLLEMHRPIGQVAVRGNPTNPSESTRSVACHSHERAHAVFRDFGLACQLWSSPLEGGGHAFWR